jgi:hypothetical protein
MTNIPDIENTIKDVLAHYVGEKNFITLHMRHGQDCGGNIINMTPELVVIQGNFMNYVRIDEIISVTIRPTTIMTMIVEKEPEKKKSFWRFWE